MTTAMSMNGRGCLALDGVDLDTFIVQLLEHHATTSTLVVCSTQDAFVQRLITAISQKPTNDGRPHTLLEYTLRMISRSRTLRVAFCPSLDVLRAFLSAHTAEYQASNTAASANIAQQPLFAVLDIVDIHRETSNWSAQGLSHTFAMAVEASRRAGQRLLLAEPRSPMRRDNELSEAAQSHAPDDEHDDEDDIKDVQADDGGPPTSVWEEQVAVLNVATKSFGAGERGWAGRTVRVRKIVERWCTIKTMASNSDSA